MGKKKSNKEFLFGTALDTALALSSPTAFVVKKCKDYIDKIQDEGHQEEVEASQMEKTWLNFIRNLKYNSQSERAAIMFVSHNIAYQIWEDKSPYESGIVYIPMFHGVPEGITINGPLSEGVLYVTDPRDDTTYYPAEEISLVLLKDRLLEMKSVFERLGATQIDISFVSEDDEKDERNHSDSQDLSVHYGPHSGKVGHNHSSSSKRHTTKYNQLEIHKKLNGVVAEIDWEKCYWINNDDVFESEVNSIREGITNEVNFKEVAKSYISQSSASMHKIEAEYSYLQQLGVSANVSWSNESLSELSKSTVWNVHVVISPAASKIIRTPDEEEEDVRNFSMEIKDVFSVTRRGIVVCGCVATGEVYPGNTVYIEDSSKAVAVKVFGIEMFQRLIDKAEYGDNPGILMEGIGKSDVKIGSMLLSEELVSKPIVALPYRVSDIEDDEEDEMDAPKGNGFTKNEMEYIEEYKFVLKDGEISDRERRSLQRYAARLGLTEERVKELEAGVVATSLTDCEQKYLEEYKIEISEGEIGNRERKRLNRLADSLGISLDRTRELENMVD